MLSSLLRSFHDGIFVITTPNAVERHENIREQIGTDGVEFVYSIDKDSVTKEGMIADGTYDEDLAVKADPKRRTMTLGHICCSIGHRRAYERVVERGCKRALIFEDDVVDLHVPDDTVAEILANVPSDAELIQWGWIGGRFAPTLGAVQQAIDHVKFSLGRGTHDHRRIRNIYMRPYNKHFHVAAGNYLAHAYTLTGAAAERLIPYTTPIRSNADHALLYAVLDEVVRGYVPVTQLFAQRSIDPGDAMESMTQKYY